MDDSSTFLLEVFLDGVFEFKFEPLNNLPGRKSCDIITASVDSGLKANLCERICGENAGNLPNTSCMVVSAKLRTVVCWFFSSACCSLYCQCDNCSAWLNMLVDTLFLPKVDGLFWIVRRGVSDSFSSAVEYLRKRVLGFRKETLFEDILPA